MACCAIPVCAAACGLKTCLEYVKDPARGNNGRVDNVVHGQAASFQTHNGPPTQLDVTGFFPKQAVMSGHPAEPG